MHYVVAYDISSDRRRGKVLSALKDFGMPVQFSVVECHLDRARLALLKERILSLIDKRHDRLTIYAFCDNCFFRAERLGREPGTSL
jgi:CRISPR-associated protein Cas2